MRGGADPERELVRRAAPFGAPALALALLGGTAAAGWGVGWSAALGVVVVVANLVASGLSMAWAARISLTALAVVSVGGFAVRLGAIVAAMWALNRLAWFSPLAFGLAVVPATLLLLGYEMRLLAGGLGAELRLSADPAGGVGPSGRPTGAARRTA